MALSSVVAVADNGGIDPQTGPFAFVPGDAYPPSKTIELAIRDQPFLRSAPTAIVPAVAGASVTFGTLEQGTQPEPIIPQEHSLRELFFDATYMLGSWNGAGSTPTLRVNVSAGVRDNTPGGDDPPDDPFVWFVAVRAICIWTQEAPTLLDQLVHDVRRVIPL
jgi:hypothetical protein